MSCAFGHILANKNWHDFSEVRRYSDQVKSGMISVGEGGKYETHQWYKFIFGIKGSMEW